LFALFNIRDFYAHFDEFYENGGVPGVMIVNKCFNALHGGPSVKWEGGGRGKTTIRRCSVLSGSN